jgi:hypothetical protein
MHHFSITDCSLRNDTPVGETVQRVAGYQRTDRYQHVGDEALEIIVRHAGQPFLVVAID